MSDDKDRIRRRAYQIWLEEGRPEGREAAHWEMARELVAIENEQKTTAKPVRPASGHPQRAADTAEQISPPAREAEKSLAEPTGSSPKTAPATKPARPPSPRPRGKRS